MLTRLHLHCAGLPSTRTLPGRGGRALVALVALQSHRALVALVAFQPDRLGASVVPAKACSPDVTRPALVFLGYEGSDGVLTHSDRLGSGPLGSGSYDPILSLNIPQPSLTLAIR